ncbi:ribokinase [Paeniglutamicibacter terrestris]|uniref:Ribokinase n=1 Tax=Paeniglutamicibacter terrestris TaxID=2723403 RepID=A0ABX1G2I7_9MICC|nr:ribokinase [Paeniglutamicibacter terrestris]NKG19790.1 ribokinase [Paeniglutamicibacter terrestris]
MATTTQVTIVGSSNVDITAMMRRLPSPGETVLADSYRLTPGGKGANQALAAALAGATTEFIGAVGNDSHAEIALGQLAEAGVVLDRVKHIDGATGVAIISVDAQAENSIAVISGANSAMDEVAVRAAGALAGVLVLQGEIPASGIRAAIDAATGPIVLNLAPVIELDRDYLCRANPLVVNEHEAALILAQLEGTAELSTDPEAVIAQRLCDQGLESVVITMGGDGALVAQRGEDSASITTVAASKVTAVDTTGAGDAFTGALAARLAIGETLIDAAGFASRFAALSVQGHGAQASYPRSLENL